MESEEKEEEVGNVSDKEEKGTVEQVDEVKQTPPIEPVNSNVNLMDDFFAPTSTNETNNPTQSATVQPQNLLDQLISFDEMGSASEQSPVNYQTNSALLDDITFDPRLDNSKHEEPIASEPTSIEPKSEEIVNINQGESSNTSTEYVDTIKYGINMLADRMQE